MLWNKRRTVAIPIIIIIKYYIIYTMYGIIFVVYTAYVSTHDLPAGHNGRKFCNVGQKK